MNKKVEITTADNAGFCFGVKRAIDLAEQTLKDHSQVYTLGPIIHNPQEVKRLEEKGAKIVDDVNGLDEGCVIIRTHGIALELRNKLKEEKKLKVVDATCPFVKKAQDIVNNLSSENKTIIIVGEKDHPEVEALVSYGGDKCFVIENHKGSRNFEMKEELNIVSQTTQTPKNFNDIVEIFKEQHSINVYDTICKATLERQESACNLAKKVDLMIVVGGKNSGNMSRLVHICSSQTKTFHIETADDINKKWLRNVKTIGLTAGASTPDTIIKSVERRLEEILNL